MVSYRKSPAKKSPKKRSVKKVTKLSKPMTLAIKNIIHKQAENKVKDFATSTAINNYNGSNFNNFNIIPLSPFPTYLDISQGTGQGARTGNKITTMKASIKFAIYPRAYEATTNAFPQPQDVRIVILKSKDTPIPLQSVSSLGNFFQYGSSTSGPSGLLTDIVKEINKDLYTIYYDKVIKVGCASATGLGAAVNAQYFANNDYKFNQIRKIDLTKMMHKTITFNDNTTIAETPTLQMIIFPCGADGQYLNSVPLYWYYNLHYEYEDM